MEQNIKCESMSCECGVCTAVQSHVHMRDDLTCYVVAHHSVGNFSWQLRCCNSFNTLSSVLLQSAQTKHVVCKPGSLQPSHARSSQAATAQVTRSQVGEPKLQQSTAYSSLEHGSLPCALIFWSAHNPPLVIWHVPCPLVRKVHACGTAVRVRGSTCSMSE